MAKLAVMTHSNLQIPGYLVHGPIGQGGMASVYLATQESLNRKVAIKVLRNGHDTQFNERFINEAHFIASLNNPHIITIHDISTLANGDYYIAMEYLDGGDLSENREQFREPAAILRLIRQIAQGLAVVHAKGIIHRDVKPANILIRKDGSAVLTDFGIAKDVDNDSDLTMAGHSLGSPSYSSPEQAQGQPLDITTDIYGLGVILLELLLGYNPFKGNTHTSTAINHIQQALPALPAEHAYLQPLLDRMLAKRPGERFQSCEELVEAIAPLLDPTASGTRPATARPLPSRLPGKMPRCLLPVLGVVAAVTVVFALTYESETEREINRLLEQAEQGLEEGRLVAPEQDNARYYYRQVLLLEQDNSEAHEGLERVTQMQVQSYVARGAEALERGDLTKPRDKNALHYYRAALALEEDNPQAMAGIDQLAAEYSRRARTHLLEGDLDRAHRDTNTGLGIQPDNAELLALRTEIDAKMPAAKKLIRDVFGKIRKTIDGDS